MEVVHRAALRTRDRVRTARDVARKQIGACFECVLEEAVARTDGAAAARSGKGEVGSI